MKASIKNQWKRVTAKRPRLTRRGKLVRNLVCLVFLAGLCYLLLGAPPLTAEQAFRKAERQNLAGPSELIAAVSLKKLDLAEPPGEVQLGETPMFDREWAKMGFFAVGEEGGTLSYVWQYGSFTYFNQVEETGDVTFFPVWTCENEDGMYEGGLILLKTELEQAARAEVWICEHSTRYYNYLMGEGTAVGDGVFVLPAVAAAAPLEAEYADTMENTIDITIYDENEKVIYREVRAKDEGGT